MLKKSSVSEKIKNKTEATQTSDGDYGLKFILNVKKTLLMNQKAQPNTQRIGAQMCCNRTQKKNTLTKVQSYTVNRVNDMHKVIQRNKTFGGENQTNDTNMQNK